MLTPKGLEEKGKLNIRFLKRKVAEYEETKKQIMELAREADKESSEDISPEDILEILNVISWNQSGTRTILPPENTVI